jgi:hypothetical protein
MVKLTKVSASAGVAAVRAVRTKADRMARFIFCMAVSTIGSIDKGVSSLGLVVAL